MAITVLILGYSFLKGENLFKRQVVAYSFYPKTDGLIKSNNVLYHGLKIGRVTNMDIDKSTGMIRVEMEFEKGYQIPKGSVARIISSDLLGTKAIEIIYGDSSVGYISGGDTLSGENEPTISEEINKQVLPVKIKAEKLLGSLDTLTNRLQYIFREEAVDEGLQKFLRSLDNIQRTTTRIDGFVNSETSRLALFLSNLTTMSDTLAAGMKDISNTLNNVSSISDSLANEDFASKLSQTLASAEIAFRDLAEISKKINDSEGTIGKLLSDDSIYTQLNSTLKHLDILLVEIDKYPSAVLFNGDKRKKEKKKRKAKGE